MSTRYANFDLTTGANDGTSEADAWQSWSDASSGWTAGDYLYVKKTASRHTEGAANSQISLAAFGSTGSAIGIIEGYDTTPGDGGLFESGNRFQVQSNGMIVRNFDIQVDDDSNAAVLLQTEGTIENCTVTQQGLDAIVLGFASPSTRYGRILNCTLRRTTDGGAESYTEVGVTAAIIDGCLIEDDRKRNASGDATVSLGGSDTGVTFVNNVVVGASSGAGRFAVRIDNNGDCPIHVLNNTFFRFDTVFSDDGGTFDAPVFVARNVADNFDNFYEIDASNAQARRFIRDNVYSNMAGTFYNGTDSDNQENNTSVSSALVSPGTGDFNPTDDTIAAAVSLASGAELVPGAIQASTGGGGGTTIPGSAFGLLPVMRASEIG